MGVSWSLLGRSWALLGCFWAFRASLGSLLEFLGAILGPLGVLFGLLGSLSGASWSLLGRSWAVLGRNWVVLERLLGHFDFRLFFRTILGAKRVPKGRHFGSQNGAKIYQKRRCKSESEKVTSWSGLGAILGRCPRRLGVKHIVFSLAFKRFREHPRFR